METAKNYVAHLIKRWHKNGLRKSYEIMEYSDLTQADKLFIIACMLDDNDRYFYDNVNMMTKVMQQALHDGFYDTLIYMLKLQESPSNKMTASISIADDFLAALLKISEENIKQLLTEQNTEYSVTHNHMGSNYIEQIYHLT